MRVNAEDAFLILTSAVVKTLFSGGRDMKRAILLMMLGLLLGGLTLGCSGEEEQPQNTGPPRNVELLKEESVLICS